MTLGSKPTIVTFLIRDSQEISESCDSELYVWYDVEHSNTDQQVKAVHLDFLSSYLKRIVLPLNILNLSLRCFV